MLYIGVRNVQDTVQLLFNILHTKCPKFVEDIFSFIFSNLIFLYAYEWKAAVVGIISNR